MINRSRWLAVLGVFCALITAPDAVLGGARPDRDALALARIKTPPLGLPPVPVTADNPPTRASIALGRKLFFDRRLSPTGTMSCATCHIPAQGFTDTTRATPAGVGGRRIRRNAPSLYNVAYAKALFHDGRAATLESQIFGPLLAPAEMANPSIGTVISRLGKLADYAGRFEAAFGVPVNKKTLGLALADFQRSLLSAASRVDRWLFANDWDAVDNQIIAGFKLFTTKARCSICHKIDERSALFVDHSFHNTGIGQNSRDDTGRMAVTDNPADRGRFRTPSLRNIALSAPYMHDGSLKSLMAVVRFYNNGGQPNPGLDTEMRQLGLTTDEMNALVAFMKALTGENVKLLIKDAQSSGTGN